MFILRREFGAFQLLLFDLLASFKNFDLKKRPISFPFSLIYSTKDFSPLLSFSPEAELQEVSTPLLFPAISLKNYKLFYLKLN